MKKVVFGQKKKTDNNTKKVVQDADNFTKVGNTSKVKLSKLNIRKSRSSNNEDSPKTTDISNLSNIDYDYVNRVFLNISKTKSKDKIQRYIRQIQKLMPSYIQTLEDIGMSMEARKVARINRKLNGLIELMDTAKPRAFFDEFIKIYEVFKTSNPEVQSTGFEDDSFLDDARDTFKNITPTHVSFTKNTPATVIVAPVSFFFFRKISDRSKKMLENLGCKFVSNVGGMLYSKAKFLALNPKSFPESNFKSASTAILKALSKDIELIPIFDISKHTNNYFVVLCCPPSYARTFEEITGSINNMEIHING